MPKTYDISDCPVARTLDLIGERWTILLLRDLLRQGPRRFQDFQTSLPGVAPNILSARLKSLEDNELVHPSSTAIGRHDSNTCSPKKARASGRWSPCAIGVPSTPDPH